MQSARTIVLLAVHKYIILLLFFICSKSVGQSISSTMRNISPVSLKTGCAGKKALHTQLVLLQGNTSIAGQSTSS